MQLKKFITDNILVLLLIIYSCVFLFSNYATFPYFEGDEGIYVSRARAFIETGKLVPEAYWYDHAPLGWIFISPFLKFLYSLSIFESYLLAGRFIIVILSVLSIYFLYEISKYFFKQKQNLTQPLALITCLLYILSPIYIYFGKRVLLDNIMVFWVLFSLFILVKAKSRLSSIIASSLLFSVAVLTKENAIVYIIPFIYILLISSKKISRKKKLVWYLVPFVFIVGLYPLYAYSRGELFSNDYFKNDGTPSLISTLIFQANRNKSFIFDLNNNFWKYLRFWLNEDNLTVGIGLISGLVLLVFGLIKKEKKSIIISLFVLSQTLFLMRGGIVYEFYIIPLLPFLCLAAVYLIYIFLNNKTHAFLIFLPFILLNIYNSSLIKGSNPYTDNQTFAQIEAIKWLKDNKSNNTNDISIGDSYLKADFYNKNVKSHLDVEYNGEFKNKINNKNIKIDSIIYTRQMDWDLKESSFVKNLINKSKEVEDYKSGGWDIKIYRPF